MRKFHVLPLVAAVALAACGSQESVDADADGTISADEAADALSKVDAPRPGLYKTSAELIDFDIPNLPKEQKEMFRGMFSSGLAQGSEYCLTAEEAENAGKQMAQGLAEGDCTYNDFTMGGGSLKADMVCKDEDGQEGHVTLDGTMTSEGADMTMEMNQAVPEVGDVKMKMRMTSERVGDCPA